MPAGHGAGLQLYPSQSMPFHVHQPAYHPQQAPPGHHPDSYPPELHALLQHLQGTSSQASGFLLLNRASHLLLLSKWSLLMLTALAEASSGTSRSLWTCCCCRRTVLSRCCHVALAGNERQQGSMLNVSLTISSFQHVTAAY